MYQSFSATTRPEQGPPRLSRLRDAMAGAGVDAFLVPRADIHQGEYVAPCDERLAWLTGFTGSAGFCAITAEKAALFIDGRYTIQAREQTAEVFDTLDAPREKPGDWLLANLPQGAIVAFDPWLHTKAEIDRLSEIVQPSLALRPIPNLIDRIWDDRPPPPSGVAQSYPAELAGATSSEKRGRIAGLLKEAGQKAAVLTLPDSIAWLLNIRGSDLPRFPIMQALAIIHEDARVSLFVDAIKVSALGPDPNIDIHDRASFEAALGELSGPVRVDRSTAPVAVSTILEEAGVDFAWGSDPCILPKACKTSAEIAATREAHLRDAAAMCEFLAWLDREAPKGELTEISAAEALEGFRRSTNMLKDISFDTISAAGPNAALPHYRVTEDSNRPIRAGELYLVDSGGQYEDGTTDITRTVAVGQPPAEAIDAFTRVLQGMIAISTVRFPRGLAGRDLDSLARAPLWRAGMDYDHGTGHGVGVYLGVHEGPQRLSRVSEVELKEGMILSNEPGYYRAGAFGIRSENLIVVREAEKRGDGRDQLDFETITFVPIDTRLVDGSALAPWERDWLNTYHDDVWQKLEARVSDETRDWLEAATAKV